MQNGIVSKISVTLLAITLLGTLACLDDSITGTRELSFSMTIDLTTPTTGQDITVSFDATGTGLSSVAIDFGDGVVETKTYVGPIEVGGQATHAYGSTGVFIVRGEAVANAGVASDEITVTVN